jgi:hypothetical protein
LIPNFPNEMIGWSLKLVWLWKKIV